jgi:serine protease Do
MDRRGFFRAGAAGIAAAPVLTAAAVAPARAADPPPAGFAPVVAKLLPTVVSVYVRAVVQKPGPNGAGHTAKDAAFSNYATQQSQGSGFFIHSAGYIVTNRHVIENAYAITVVLEDQRELRARLVGKLTRIDLALLKVDASKPLPAVEFGNSDLVQPGDAVLAIGNPLGLGGTVTSGIVSALNRNISETPFDDFIQIDAAINHGNSGGPLFNAAGELIGVNTAFFSPNGSTGSVGLGFAIPSNDVAWVIEQLRSGRGLHPGWIDIEVQSVADEVAEAFGRPGPGGAIVVSVLPDSVPGKAGIRQGDIIIRYNGLAVPDVRGFAREVAKTTPGKVAPMIVWRDRREVALQVPIVPWRGNDNIAGIPPELSDANVAKGMQAAHFGLHLVPLTPALRREWGMSATQRGVLIDSVVPFSVADNHNLRPGEVIMNVMETPTATPEEVLTILKRLHDAGAKYAALLVGNDNGVRWLSLPVAAGVA